MSVAGHPIRLGAALLVCIATMRCGGCPRADDPLEPNNVFEAATVLQVGLPIDGRILEGDVDIFSYETDPAAGSVLRFDLRDTNPNDEDCAYFRVYAPGPFVLLEHGGESCSMGPVPGMTTSATGVQVTVGTDGSALFEVPVTQAGQYFLAIEEGHMADNVFTFSWDYQIVVSQGN